MRPSNQSISQSSLNAPHQQIVHLSSFQAALPPPPPLSVCAVVKKPQIACPHPQMQPPKPPERSCSFKDVDNLQQQQLLDPKVSTNKRFCMNELEQSLNSINTHQHLMDELGSSATNRPKSKLFNCVNNEVASESHPKQSTTIKITAMKLNNSDEAEQALNANKFKLNSAVKQPSSEPQKPVEVPEFQRVFTHLRKVPKTSNCNNSDMESTASSASDSSQDSRCQAASPIQAGFSTINRGAQQRLFPKTSPTPQPNGLKPQPQPTDA